MLRSTVKARPTAAQKSSSCATSSGGPAAAGSLRAAETAAAAQAGVSTAVATAAGTAAPRNPRRVSMPARIILRAAGGSAPGIRRAVGRTLCVGQLALGRGHAALQAHGPAGDELPADVGV